MTPLLQGSRSRRTAGLAAVWLSLVFAAGAQTQLSTTSVPGYPGGSALMPVRLTRATNVVAAQFDVAYQPARVHSGAALAGPGTAQSVVLSREVAPGVRRVLAFSLANTPLTNRTPVQLPFTVAAGEYVASGPITPTNAILARANGTAAPAPSLSGGTIFVRPVNVLPEGEVQLFLPTTPDLSYVIQATTNFVHWVNISTNLATGPFLDVIDFDAGLYPRRFYRWQQPR